MGIDSSNVREALGLLFHEKASMLEGYVGLLHWANQPPFLQQHISAAKTASKRLAWTDKRWAASLELPGLEAMSILEGHLLEEAETTRDRLAVAVGAALKALDRALDGVRDHNAVVRLPDQEPFAGAVYRLLQPAENPVEQWIHEAGDHFDLPRFLRWLLGGHCPPESEQCLLGADHVAELG